MTLKKNSLQLCAEPCIAVTEIFMEVCGYNVKDMSELIIVTKWHLNHVFRPDDAEHMLVTHQIVLNFVLMLSFRRKSRNHSKRACRTCW